VRTSDGHTLTVILDDRDDNSDTFFTESLLT